MLEMFANGVWSLKPVPLPRYSNPANGAELDSVSCTPGNHCIAVGSYNTDQNGESQALIRSVSDSPRLRNSGAVPPQAIAFGRKLHSFCPCRAPEATGAWPSVDSQTRAAYIACWS